MDINELIDTKNELLSIYDDKTLNNKNDSLLKEELNYIEKEINKLDSLIKIYENDDTDYRVMKLERLYMQNISNLSKEEFDNLSMDDKFKIYYNSFPKEWSISIPLEEQLNYLEDAIIDNELIKVKDDSLILKK
jgi:hypothetical protein